MNSVLVELRFHWLTDLKGHMCLNAFKGFGVHAFSVALAILRRL